MASIFVDCVLGSAAVTDEQIVVPVVHAQHQHDALTVFADTKVVAVIDGHRRIVDIAVVVLVVVHSDNVHTAVIPPRDLIGHQLQLQPLVLVQQAHRVINKEIILGLLRPCGNRHRQYRQQGQQICQNSFFHLSRPPYINISIVAAIAVTGAAMAAKMAQNLPMSVGRSPTSLPVCPFMAKRKSLPFHLVCSIQTGSSA